MEFFNKYLEENNVIVRYSIFINGSGNKEYHLMFVHDNSCLDFEKQLDNINKSLHSITNSNICSGSSIVFKRYFLSDAANQYEHLSKPQEGNPYYVVSAIQQPPLNGSKVALWVYMANGLQMKSKDGNLQADSNGYTHLWTAQMHGQGTTSHQQTESIFTGIEQVLDKEGCTLKDNCIRTWLFVHNVDINYQGVVEARKAYFNKRDLVSQTHYISSTGIEGRNNNPHALVIADSYSVKGIIPEQIRFLKASSHMNPTYEYGVTFERGTAVSYGDRQHIFISGTASINNKGEIVHPCEVYKQAERAMENIEALLEEAESGSEDIAQMIVYLRDVADYSVIEGFFQSRYTDIPKVIVLAPVCRPGWLIEIECIAVSKQNQPQYQNF